MEMIVVLYHLLVATVVMEAISVVLANMVGGDEFDSILAENDCKYIGAYVEAANSVVEIVVV